MSMSEKEIQRSARNKAKRDAYRRIADKMGVEYRLLVELPATNPASNLYPTFTCPKCGMDYPISGFPFSYRRERGYGCVRLAMCTECYNAKAREKYSELDKTNLVEPPAHKKCLMCRKVLPRSEFWTAKMAKDGLYYVCKKCGGVKNSKARERVSRSPEARERRIRRQREWRLQNKRNGPVNPNPDRSAYYCCSACNKMKRGTEFYRHSEAKSGLAKRCKECVNKKSYEYNQTERGKELARAARANRRAREKAEKLRHIRCEFASPAIRRIDDPFMSN